MARGIKINWTEEMINLVKKDFPVTCNKVLAGKLGVGWRSLVRKARELGVEKDLLFRDTLDFKAMAKEFCPEPWNKGMKGVKFPGSEKGWFQKGHKLSPFIPKEVRSEKRKELIRKEKIRIKYGLGQKTKLKIKNIYDI